jgi:inner membrane protein
MDNLCHTLAGAAIGEAGLKTRTRFGNPALMIASNLPDLDVLVFLTGTPAVSFRRGWTHGVLAQALLPMAFAGLLLLWDLCRPSTNPKVPPARAGALLLISYVGVLSHVLLDYLNNYGVRLLMPVSGRWFYGDTLFIVDVWVWLILGLGVYWSRRRSQTRYARRALAATAIYIVLMFVSATASRRIVLEDWIRTRGSAPKVLMVGPLPVTPLSKAIIVDAGDHFETGTFSWIAPHVRLDGPPLPNRLNDPAVTRARENPRVVALLGWSRFPYFDLTQAPDGALVTFTDLRFGARVGRTTVFVPR